MRKFSFDMAHLRKYSKGELSPKEMHEIERAAHEDEMLMDILIGMELENAQHSARSPIPNIRQRIVHRTQFQKTRKSFLHNRFLQIAASIVVLLTAATVFFWSKQEKSPSSESIIATNDQHPNEQQLTPTEHKETPPSEPKKELLEESDNQKLSNRPQQQQEKAKPSTADRALSVHEKHILAYTPTPSNVEYLEEVTGTLNLGHPQHENDVIIINTEAKDSKSSLMASNAKKQTKSKMANSRVSSNPDAPLSAAQMRAKLNNMGRDPQADFMSVQVIDRKSGKPLSGASVQDGTNDNITVTDSNGRFSYATADKKNLTINAVGYRTKEITTESGVQTILLSPLENGVDEFTENSISKTSKSAPSNGMDAYRSYLRKEIAKLTNLPYEFNLQMELDKKGKPTRIVVSKSSDKTLNQKIIDLVEKGPVWKRGTDWKKINIYLKSL